jgi:putrescine aminotransferase
VEAVTAQMRRLPLSSKTFLNQPLADLSEKLAHCTPGSLQFSFFCNSGAEAIEGAIKFARCSTGRYQILSTIGSYHGKTLGALSASGRAVYKTPFEPLIPGFDFVPFGDSSALESAIGSDTAAVLLEPIQGENGVCIPPPDYLTTARALCDQHGALLILDEVQTGLGRTGTLFACEQAGIAPDLMTLAKALGGGVMPIGAIVGTPSIWEKVFRENPYIHTSTFGGGEAACIAGLTTLQIIERDNLCEQAKRRGEQLLAGLQGVVAEFPALLTEARGKGLMIGVEFTDADIGKLAIGALVRNGVIAAYTLNNPKVMRFEPPLIISEVQVDMVTAAFHQALTEIQELLADFA